MAAAVTLDQLPKHQRARITGLLPSADFGNLDALVTVRLKELGFLPGAELTVVGFGLFGGDPVAVRIGTTKFALRLAEARKVAVIALAEAA
jgi:ferrous iron transport protein A